MNSYWFTYKTDKWPIEKLRALVKGVEAGSGTVTEWWRVSASKSARIGDRAYMFKQGGGRRGIFGTGEIIDGPELRSDTDGDDGERFRVLIKFEKLVDPTKEFLLSLEEIEDFVRSELVNTQSSGIQILDGEALELDSLLNKKFGSEDFRFDESACDISDFDPEAIVDHRERALQAIRTRRGQAAFRLGLLSAYDNRCCITNCSVVDVLEAAHIYPYLGRLTNDLSNGILLRADLHTLFDCLLISINPKSREVEISDKLRSSSYKALEGKKLRAPSNEARGPSKKAFESHYSSFKRHMDQRGG